MLIESKLETHFRTISSTGSQAESEKLKQLLYTSQLNTKNTAQSVKKGEFSEIVTLLKQLNESIFELYNIPKSIRRSIGRKDRSI